MSIQWLPLVWSPVPWLTVRRIASRSIRRACSGSSSPNWTPGRLVAIAPNGPRKPPGASGLGSQVSMWPGPPLSQKRMTLVSLPGAVAAPASRSRSSSGRARPPRPSTPAWRKLRRVIPAQSLAAPPKTRNIRETPQEHPLHDQLMLNQRNRVTVKGCEEARIRFDGQANTPGASGAGIMDKGNTNSGNREGLMVDRWFFGIELPITFEQFKKLPTNPAYKYEYFSGKAWLSPRPKECHVLLELPPGGGDPAGAAVTEEPVQIRPLEAADWGGLDRLFAGSFHRVQPFASLSDEQRLESAGDCLRFTREGGDGPLIEPACFVAVSPEGQSA